MLNVVSLFSGCGGLDLGFQGGFDFLGHNYYKTGFNIIWANEINKSACKTYKLNIGSHIRSGDIAEEIKTIPSSCDVVIGGFPCQDISINGKMAGINGNKSRLYSYIVNAVKILHPKIFVVENVSSLLMARHRQSLEQIINDFSDIGYNLHYKCYMASDFGVPQTRERVFIIGTQNGENKFLPPQPISSLPITAREAIEDLEDIPKNVGFSHIWSEAKVSSEQGNRKLIANRPGYTIRAECHGNIQFHYKLPRRISMREAARIQSFPDSFIFPCGLRETERQIGNAVPPVLAWHIALAVKKTIVCDGNHDGN